MKTIYITINLNHFYKLFDLHYVLISTFIDKFLELKVWAMISLKHTYEDQRNYVRVTNHHLNVHSIR